MEVIRVDLDDTLCFSDGLNYLNAKPNQIMIDHINERKKNGDYIIIWSSRGVGRNIDLTEMTMKQLFKWNVEYDELHLDKPYYDKIICDKAVSPRDIERSIIDEQVLDYNI